MKNLKKPGNKEGEIGGTNKFQNILRVRLLRERSPVTASATTTVQRQLCEASLRPL